MDPQVFAQQQGSADTPASAEGQENQALPPTSPQAAVPPGQGQQQAPDGHPDQQQDQVDPQGQPPRNDETEQLRQQSEHLRRQNEQLNQALGGVQQWAEQQRMASQQQQAQQRYQQRIDHVRRVAENMNPQDALEYQQRESANLVHELMQQQQQIIRQAEQQREQDRRQMATPLYIRHLVENAGLPKDYEERLMAFGDPELAARQVPYFQREYQDKQKLQQQIDQLARTTQANQIMGQASGMSGGVTSPQNVQLPADASPDDKAREIYKQLKSGTYNG